MWDGTRYVTENGPYKLALFGSIQGASARDHPRRGAGRPAGARIELQLEHRPRYNNLALRTVFTKSGGGGRGSTPASS